MIGRHAHPYNVVRDIAAGHGSTMPVHRATTSPLVKP